MDNLALSQGGNLNLVSAALAAAAGNINLNIAVGTNAHIIDGQFFTRAANASIAWPVAAAAVFSTPNNGAFTGGVSGSTRLYGLYMDVSGNLSVVAGPVVDSLELSGGRAPLQFTPNVRNRVCFGFVRVAVTSGTTFIPSVTAQNAAGVTTTYLNVAAIPGSPLQS